MPLLCCDEIVNSFLLQWEALLHPLHFLPWHSSRYIREKIMQRGDSVMRNFFSNGMRAISQLSRSKHLFQLLMTIIVLALFCQPTFSQTLPPGALQGKSVPDVIVGIINFIFSDLAIPINGLILVLGVIDAFSNPENIKVSAIRTVIILIAYNTFGWGWGQVVNIFVVKK